ncbi:MAG: cytochrome B [Alphaproteobacteria bacterium CG_4_10_14_0_2_um_filter_63_37]|nr:MAG: cytochrome B [Proteobacteria bacterium CG1_02_64_396]PJA24280.1 MAG: cytochrome B [Alphaproteobacteria bacterium CG_4_10_14_0_2_um_filter_63_37]
MSEQAATIEVSVWDRTTRWFHWINVLCVVSLSFLALALLNGKALGLSGEGKILLKTVHVYMGYVFAANLSWRVVWGFIGGKYSRWKAVLPLGVGFIGQLKDYVAGAKSGNPPQYAGHNPMGKLMVAALFLVLFGMASTGLVLAGTDLYLPPYGGHFAAWVTGGDPSLLAHLAPGSKEYVVPTLYDEMRNFRKPFVEFHEEAFWVLLGLVAVHVGAVVVTEIRERSNLISAMFTGRKVLRGKPVDADK